ncbi:MAG: hypothetical protein FWH04_08835 [Oscillospiraceae bacterium]|nr:hypothetical protein [Oscillospiraceae bacterium]
MELELDNLNPEEVSFVYLVYNCVPEFMPHMAFRREKHFKTIEKKTIKCPYCRKAFTTVDATDKVELYCHSRKTEGKYHASIACKTCRNQVGIVYASA